MAIDQRSGTKVIKNLRREEAIATRVDPYPYIGIVKNNLDPTRSGRLQVWIPDLGAAEDDQLNWRTVSYASPFMGYTSHQQSASDPINTDNTFEGVTHSYGMWMVPPDIGVQIIVLFVAGDPTRGYWLACVNPNLSHHMIPALAGSPNAVGNKGAPAPVVEFNENVTENVTNPSFYNISKPVHKIQAGILKVQGLDQDPIRGAISSSSQRESPSHVFGISTPGRPLNDPADDLNYISKLNSDTLPPEYYKIKSRKGGHVFVMDDGATLGQDQLVRLRTAKGHQILMHDSSNTLYIAHADGTSWVELTSDGKVNIYSQGAFSVRSESEINLHSDTNININASNNINLKAGNKIQTESVRTTLLTGSLGVEASGDAEFKTGSRFNVETGASMSLKVASTYALEAQTILNNSGGTVGVGQIKGFVVANKDLNTIVTVTPTHEPFYRGVSPAFFNPENSSSGITPQATYTGAVDATKNVGGTEVKSPAGTKDLRNQPDPTGTVGNLSKDQMTAYLAQIGKSESGGNYNTTNQLGYVGKYQMGYQALIDQGYVKSSVTSNAQLDNPNSWTGKDGIADKSSWLGNGSVQESAMMSYTQNNYTAMIKNGAITADMPPEDVGGMLAASHLLGAGGANTWRKGGGGADANGTTGDTYFQKGKFAISVLAPQVSAVKAG
jgi:uncharacterized protein YaiE (UPF0345 family)